MTCKIHEIIKDKYLHLNLYTLIASNDYVICFYKVLLEHSYVGQTPPPPPNQPCLLVFIPMCDPFPLECR